MIYDRLYATATRLIKKYGTLETFTHNENSLYDPACGKPRLVGTVSYTSYVVKDSDVISSVPRNSELNDECDIRLIAEDANYSKNDTVQIDGKTYSILGYEPIYPGPKVLAVWLFLKG